MSETISKAKLLSALNISVDGVPCKYISIDLLREEIISGRFDTDGWISVEDETPKESGRYRVHLEDGSVEDADYFKGTHPYEEAWYVVKDGDIEDVTPTHWMPLPKPPKGEDNE